MTDVYYVDVGLGPFQKLLLHTPFKRDCWPMHYKQQAESVSNPIPALHEQIPKSFLLTQDFTCTTLLHDKGL